MESKKTKKTKEEVVEKIQPTKNFPLLAKYQAKFPAGDDVAYPYNHVIYTDKPEMLTPELIAHEEVHFRQQDEMGLDNWVEKYFEDANFRTQVEIEAYKAQIKYFAGNRDIQDMVRVRCAKALSSPMYGNILTYKEAYQQL